MTIDPESYKLNRIDDALHKQTAPNAFEWWYFDAIFDNGYSMVTSWHIGGTVSEIEDNGYMRIVFAIYDPDGKKTDLVVPFPDSAVSVSTETCDVKMGDNRVHGEFPRYEIHFRSGDVGGELLFENLTQGYRKPPDGVKYFGEKQDKYMAWAIAQPRAKVTGSLILAGKEIPVNGVGYHDHNWGNVLLREMCDHWYWGRLFLPNHTLICATVQLAESLGFINIGNLIAFKGETLIEESTEIYSEPSDFQIDEATGAKYPLKLIFKIKGNRIEGEVIHRIRKIIDSFEIPRAGKGHGYFRFLSDCDVNLEVDGEKVETQTEIIHELLIP